LNDLLVMKFGGTSMGSAERMRAAVRLMTEPRRPVVAVVSAMSRITDLLLDALRHAELRDEGALEAAVTALEARHDEACRELFEGARLEAALQGVESIIGDFRRIARGMLMLGARPPASADEAIAVGERLSATMMAALLEANGFGAAAVNARDVIVTDAVFGSATPIMEPTREKAARVIAPLLAAGRLPVVTGFNGATADGRPTTLGRGGSDFSASILAAALDASELWIWTDVDGIMTADPRLVPAAAVLEEITYREAAELAYNGAKVLHPRTLAPLMEKAIPVWSKNSFAPQKQGTRIVGSIVTRNGPCAVTSMAGVAMVSIDPASAEISGPRIMSRALSAIAGAGAELLALSSSSYRQNFCFLVRQEELARVAEALQSALSLEFAHGYLHPLEVNGEVGLLAVVGEGMRGTPGLAGRIFTAISRERVNIIAIAQGSSELTIAIVVHRDGLEKAVRAVHEECRLGAVLPAAIER
jgi:aspartokinase/homoserine dehydrogenase 1